eukprot:5178034-Pyramimonas_sp.AAC.1
MAFGRRWRMATCRINPVDAPMVSFTYGQGSTQFDANHRGPQGPSPSDCEGRSGTVRMAHPPP